MSSTTWSADDEALLRSIAAEGLPARVAADRLNRKLGAITSKAMRMNIKFMAYGKPYPDRVDAEEERLIADAVRGSQMLLDALFRMVA